jgi:hypothetical protein
MHSRQSVARPASAASSSPASAVLPINPEGSGSNDGVLPNRPLPNRPLPLLPQERVATEAKGATPPEVPPPVQMHSTTVHAPTLREAASHDTPQACHQRRSSLVPTGMGIAFMLLGHRTCAGARISKRCTLLNCTAWRQRSSRSICPPRTRLSSGAKTARRAPTSRSSAPRLRGKNATACMRLHEISQVRIGRCPYASTYRAQHWWVVCAMP